MSYLLDHQDRVTELFLEHLRMSGAALIIALIIALPLGVLIARVRPLNTPVMGVLGAVYTIPSLALLALLVPSQGLGVQTALIALVAYAQLILVRNIVTGLRGVDPAVVEAARGMGMSPLQMLWQVETPLALPVVLAGVRVAAVAIIGIGTVAASIDAGGLGRMLFDGVNQGNDAEISAGAIAIGVLAIGVDLILRFLEWWSGRRAGSRRPRGAAAPGR